MKKRPYYVIDTGFFGAKVFVCFSDTSFQQALKDSKITTRHNALDIGIAESHFIQQEGTHHSMLAIAFNYDDMEKTDALERMGTIYHEVSHTITHIFEYIGEDDSKIGDETRSYLGEHVFKQVFAAYATEEDRRERLRKRNREALIKLGGKSGGSQLQVDINRDRSAGQDSIPEPKRVSSRTKNANRETEQETRTGF
jgi:hypothetical protein